MINAKGMAILLQCAGGSRGVGVGEKLYGERGNNNQIKYCDFGGTVQHMEGVKQGCGNSTSQSVTYEAVKHCVKGWKRWRNQINHVCQTSRPGF